MRAMLPYVLVCIISIPFASIAQGHDIDTSASHRLGMAAMPEKFIAFLNGVCRQYYQAFKGMHPRPRHPANNLEVPGSVWEQRATAAGSRRAITTGVVSV